MTASTTDRTEPAAPPSPVRRLLSGVEAVCEALVVRHALDERAGLDTATFVSGYPGSPLGTLDLALDRLGDRRDASRIVHRPGLNEELAAAAVWGSQMGEAVPYDDVDGVAGAWYGKGPGIDRCGDVLKHANFMGTGPNGGAVLFVGDDPSAKSSTLPYDTNAPLADAAVPTLVPADQQDLLDLAVEAFRLSRACGSWVGVRIVTAVADGIGAVDTSPDHLVAEEPELVVDGEPWRHEPTGTILRPDLEELWLDRRLRAAQAWVRARGLDRTVGAGDGARLGIVCAGRTYRDVLAALEACGVSTDDLAAAGIRVLKLALTYPVVPETVRELATACDEVLVVEEKRPFVEQQVRALLQEAGCTTPVRGKRDGGGRPLVPGTGELTAERLVEVVRRVLPDLSPPPEAPRTGRTVLPLLDLPARTPAFCSGCPHNRSTVVPEGSVTGGGVGCHGMIHFEHRHAGERFVPPTPMGAEGVHWVGLAPFVGDRHIFQNLGDGTFSHSGSLAIRACVAADVHITFKLLYNTAVAMTGGQDVAGLMDVPALTRSLAAEGVSAITVCTDDTGRYGRNAAFAPGVQVRPREDVVAVQEELRAHPGVSVLVYDQRCAAEARRLRKRGELDDPPRRVVINQAVCEGCGDCSRVSNCLSVLPVATEFGERREIHQSSCNKDYSCLEGDCPSFLTVEPAGDRPRARRGRDATTDPGARPSDTRPSLPAGELPDPAVAPVDRRYSVYTTGIGGTGIVTANRLLAHAALAAGYAVQGVDQTGLSQKAGAVVSHLHVGRTDADITAATVADAGADLYLSGDLLQAAAARHLAKVRPGRSWAVVDADVVPTAGMLQGTPGVDHDRLSAAVRDTVGADRSVLADTSGLAERLFGSHLPANVLMLGIASQLGALPVPPAAVEHAIETQGPAAATNREAFRWGRWLVADPVAVEQALAGGESAGEGPTAQADLWTPTRRAAEAAERLVAARGLPAPLAPDVRALIVRRAAQVIDYQGRKLAARWLDLVARAAAGDDDAHGWALTTAVVEGWFQVLTYKDEYEVARLQLRLDLDGVADELGIDGAYKVRYHLHPPTLRRLGLDRKIAVPGGLARPAFRALAAARHLRGTPLDLPGRERHRREERALADEYGALVGAALDALTPAGYDDAVALAASVRAVRGYEDIKSDAVARWRAEIAGR